MENKVRLIKKKYKALFFDLDNTLWDFNRNAYFALRENYFRFLDNTSEQVFDHFYSVYMKNNDKLWDAYRKKAIGKKELTRKRFQDTFDEFGITGVDPDEFNDSYLNIMPGQKHLIENAREVLDYLFPKYKLFIITNGFREVQFKKLENSGLMHYFSKIFISEDIKAPKPNPEIFNYAISSANARKSESLMIGDDWEVDVMGAYNIGIDQVYLNREASPGQLTFNQKNNKPVTYQISHLIQLVALL